MASIWGLFLWGIVATPWMIVHGSEVTGRGERDRPLARLPLGLSSLMPVPVGNPMTYPKIELGRRLFFDVRLSSDGTIACASCHIPEKAFTDGREVSLGIAGRKGRRNVPSLLNLAYGRALFWDGRVDSLEEQALIPLTHPDEMGNSLEGVLMTLDLDASYRQAFRDAFGIEKIEGRHLAMAIAAFERSLIAGDAPYDRYFVNGELTALSVEAQRGLKLFRGKARCAHCHDGPRFTDERFYNTGVGWGTEWADLGRYEVTGSDEDRGRFKTPSLRNIAVTAPYMHDGSLATLDEVVAFYDQGGSANPFQAGTVQKLGLNARERSDLVSFLRHLTSPEFVMGFE